MKLAKGTVTNTQFFAVACLLAKSLAVSIHDANSQSSNLTARSIAADIGSAVAMAKLFVRSEVEHQASMEQIMKTMTVPRAMQLLQVNPNAATLQQVANLISNQNSLQAQTNLRKKKQPAGYSGLAGAKKLLNDMIYESLSKYDQEIAKCTDYYAKQCALMETARGEIAAANFMAANSRMLILDAQANINACEEDIPKTKYELKVHNAKCAAELEKMNARMKIVMGDIAVMTMILKMTACGKTFYQMAYCNDQCNKRSFVSFSNKALQDQVNKLASSVSKELMSSVFADLFQGIQSLKSIETEYQAPMPIINKTKFNNPPVPRTKVPGNPCNDEYKGAPSPEDKRAAKCTIKKSPQCYKLQERFLLIEAGLADERDQLQEDIEIVTANCAFTRKTLETMIENDEALLDASQTKLAFATEKEASAGEKARIVAKTNEEYNSDLVQQMKKCSTNYINFETELCALRKIRGELYKMKGAGHPGFFQDCEVSKWGPEECTKKCAGGQQKLIRSVLTHPNGGAKCLPLAAERKCNYDPCPVDCRLDAWSGWSKCSADCGGGVTQRLRDVKRAMKYGGKPCSSRKESKACNIMACERDCELSEWTKWTSCSKDCDGGTRKRQKFVKTAAAGTGNCPGLWDGARLQYKRCNTQNCKISKGPSLTCKAMLDVVLLIDGSGSLGSKGWSAEVKAATSLVSAFDVPGSEAQIAVILFSGPSNWGDVFKCIGRNKRPVDTEKVCKVKVVQHFAERKDFAKVKSAISKLIWPKGSTLTSLALGAAGAELSLGRKNAKSIVVVITDGRPMSYRKTKLASHKLRKSARLLWVPVTKFAPLGRIKSWATRRWQENVIPVKDFGKLQSPQVINSMIADVCPSPK